MSDTDRQEVHTLSTTFRPATRLETEDERSAVERVPAEPCPGTSHEVVLREFGL